MAKVTTAWVKVFFREAPSQEEANRKITEALEPLAKTIYVMRMREEEEFQPTTAEQEREPGR